MEKIRVLYADSNKEYEQMILDKVSCQDDIELVGVTEDGGMALSIIEDYKPQVVIISEILKMIDGLGVLEILNLKYGESMPKVIFISETYKEKLVKTVVDGFGAEYFMLKPYDLDILLKRVKSIASDYDGMMIDICGVNKKDDLYNQSKSINNIVSNGNSYSRGRNRGEVIDSFITNQNDTLENKVKDILDGLGAPGHLKGYVYLKDAIMMVARDSSYGEKVTKFLYPEIAEKYNATVPRVERAIRHAVGVIFKRGKKSTLDAMFTLPVNKEKLTNLEFIKALADRVRTECEE